MADPTRFPFWVFDLFFWYFSWHQSCGWSNSTDCSRPVWDVDALMAALAASGGQWRFASAGVHTPFAVVDWHLPPMGKRGRGEGGGKA